MKVFLSADIEGITGVTHLNECNITHPEYSIHQRRMTQEVVAACEAAFTAGATEVWIKDAHASARNILQEKLPRRTRLIRGWSRQPQKMLQELDDSFAAVLMIGYHSAAGHSGNPLSHTISGKLDRMHINEKLASEFLINTFTAARHGVPVVCVSGDQGLIDDVAELNPAIEGVAVMRGIGNSTLSMSYPEALEAISSGVQRGIENRAMCRVSLPPRFEVRLDYHKHMDAYFASQYPGARLEGHKTVCFETTHFEDVTRMLVFVL